MEGRSGRGEPLRIDDPIGHLVPPGQLLPQDVIDAVLVCFDGNRYGTGIGVPSVPTRFTVRLHPADRAWLPAGFQRRVAAAATERADDLGLLVLDGIRVEFETDLSCDMGTVAVTPGYTERDLVVLRNPAAAASAFSAQR